jgi:aminocarboxymuconate-semialdehyde decarboxylase
VTIDVHTHILPERIPSLRDRYGYGGWVELDHYRAGCARMVIDGKTFREVKSNCWDPAERLAECDQWGVDVQVLSTIPVMFSYWAQPNDGYDLSRFLNDHIAETAGRHPQRFIGLGTLPMQSAELAIEELHRCIRDLGFPGVMIGTNVNGRNLDDPEIFRVFEAAQELDAAVFIHPWQVVGRERMEKYWLPWLVGMPAETSLAICSMIFGCVFERLPRLRFLFAHGGGAFPASIGRVEKGFLGRPDLCAVDNPVNPREYLRRIYFDSLVHEPRVLRYMVDLIGADRIALGSDYPFPLGESPPGKAIDDAGFDDLTRERMRSGTAREWLGRG